MNRKLSNRAIEILMAIRERTGEDGGFWLPGETRGTSDWVSEFSTYANINGSGSAAILRSLKQRNLIKRPPGCTILTEYAYHITEDGVLAIEKARESGQLTEVAEECYKRKQRLWGRPDEVLKELK